MAKVVRLIIVTDELLEDAPALESYLRFKAEKYGLPRDAVRAVSISALLDRHSAIPAAP